MRGKKADMDGGLYGGASLLPNGKPTIVRSLSMGSQASQADSDEGSQKSRCSMSSQKSSGSMKSLGSMRSFNSLTSVNDAETYEIDDGKGGKKAKKVRTPMTSKDMTSWAYRGLSLMHACAVHISHACSSSSTSTQ